MHTQTPPIQSEEEYDAALVALATALNPDSDDLPDHDFEHLVDSITSYENIHYPTDFPTALSAIEFHMDQFNLSVKDIAHCFGSPAKTRDVLAGRRDLTLSMKRSLHKNLQIAADVLLGEPDADFDSTINLDEIQHYPWRTIVNKKWIKPWVDWKDRSEEMFGELSRSVQNVLAPQPARLRQSKGYNLQSKSNRYAVQAWCMRIANVASDNPTPNPYMPGSVTPEFMRSVAKLSIHDDGPLQAQKHLRDNGINLVIERHLPKTYLDGAALTLQNQSVIGLTLRHDRLDNFWFTLMHELAHVALHLNDDTNETFVDDLTSSPIGSDPHEKEADAYATKSLIPSNLWKESNAPHISNPLDAYYLSQKAGVHLAIVAGRIRYESNQYDKLSQFVGQGEVRKQFFPA